MDSGGSPKRCHKRRFGAFRATKNAGARWWHNDFVLLGDGVRLFDHLGTEPIDLESTRVIEGAGVMHLTFRVVK